MGETTIERGVVRRTELMRQITSMHPDGYTFVAARLHFADNPATLHVAIV